MTRLRFKLFAVLLASFFAVGVSGVGLFAGQATPKPKTSHSAAGSSTAADAKVDLNTASEKDLVNLPGVGTATAKKIVAGRPYSSVDGLSKAGVSASTISKITSLVTVSGASSAPAVSAKESKPKTTLPPAAQPATAAPSKPVAAAPSHPALMAPSQPAPAPAAAKSSAKTTPAAAPQGSPGAGMVWVTLDSGVYHYEGTRYYGKTKNGKYMPESDAIAAGYHAAKNEKKPQ
jgi:hypothetical protein